MEGGGGLETGIPARLTAREGRRFGLVVGAAFSILAALVWWRGHSAAWKVLGVLGGALLIAGVLVPTRLGPVQRGWMGLARMLSKVTTPIAMGFVWLLVVTPTALIMRALGRRPLRHAEKDGSFWAPPQSGGRSDMKRQF
jgi:hypothetical protein